MAELELRRAEATLEHQSIRSPIAGVVVSRLMTEGEVVDEETILRVAGVERLHVEAILPADLYGSVAEGASAAVLPLTRERQEHVAHVTIIDPLIDAASSTFGVQLELPNPDRSIPAGVRCQIRFLTISVGNAPASSCSESGREMPMNRRGESRDRRLRGDPHGPPPIRQAAPRRARAPRAAVRGCGRGSGRPDLTGRRPRRSARGAAVRPFRPVRGRNSDTIECAA